MPTTEEATATDTNTKKPAPRFLPLETIPVRLQGPDVSKRNPVFGVISNMSQTGACVITNTSLPERSDICLIVGGRNEDVAVKARVVWCDERLEPVKEIVGYFTGVSFDAGAKETVRELLESGIFQLVS